MNRYVVWVFRIAVAAILIPAGYQKFQASPADVELFTTLGMEPHGRIVIGAIEFVAGMLMLSPQPALAGLLALGVMSGAIIAHVTVLGIDLRHFVLLSTVFVSALIVTYVERRNLPIIGRTLDGGHSSVP